MQIKIRKGTKDDMQALHQLIVELAIYEKAPHEVTNTVTDMIKDGFGDYPVFYSVVAETENEIAGMAIFYIKYSTWKGKGVYLEDIIVTEKYRGKGIGTLLFNQVVAEARAINAKQLHWQVLDWNETAISFYKKYPTHFDNEWINCKLNEEQIAEFLSKQSNRTAC